MKMGRKNSSKSWAADRRVTMFQNRKNLGWGEGARLFAAVSVTGKPQIVGYKAGIKGGDGESGKYQ